MLGAYDGGSSLRLITEGIPVYPRSLTIINDELGDDFMKTMGEHRVCLLFGHGITASGNSVEDVTQTCLTLYEIARINYLAYAIGQPQGVSEQDQKEYLARRESGPEQRPARPVACGGHPRTGLDGPRVVPEPAVDVPQVGRRHPKGVEPDVWIGAEG